MELSYKRWRRAGFIAAAFALLSSCLLTSSFEGLTGGTVLPDAGDYGESPEHLVCAYSETHVRSDRENYIGFRCCGG